MNCKPGDLAVVVTTQGWTFTPTLLGVVVKVTRLAVNELDDYAWEYEGRLRYDTDGDSIDVIPDSWLRPIRDPGEDATDETLLWLPVPTKEPA